VELVRRPSGGQAVLHGGDLTYALVWRWIWLAWRGSIQPE
jgi:hypothetical protein